MPAELIRGSVDTEKRLQWNKKISVWTEGVEVCKREGGDHADL
jgi:hypothetical protein